MPYCKRCGKFVQTEGDLCEDCRNSELIFGEFPTTGAPVAPADPGTRMDGFPKALVSVILGVVSFIFAIVTYVLMSAFIAGGLGVAFPIIFGILTVGGIVVSVIFGVKSIVKFVDSKRRGKVKPIATLVCGIVGCASSALAVLYLFLAVILLCFVGLI